MYIIHMYINRYEQILTSDFQLEPTLHFKLKLTKVQGASVCSNGQ